MLDLKKLIKNHSGKWVALDKKNSKVIVSGRKAVNVYNEAKKKGYKIPNLYKVPNKYMPYIG